MRLQLQPLLHALQLVQGSVILHIAGVECRCRLKQHNPSLFVGNRTVLHPARDNQEFSLLEPDMAVAKLHAEASFHHQEKLVLVLVVVPDELSLELVQLYQLAV